MRNAEVDVEVAAIEVIGDLGISYSKMVITEVGEVVAMEVEGKVADGMATEKEVVTGAEGVKVVVIVVVGTQVEVVVVTAKGGEEVAIEVAEEEVEVVQDVTTTKVLKKNLKMYASTTEVVIKTKSGPLSTRSKSTGERKTSIAIERITTTMMTTGVHRKEKLETGEVKKTIQNKIDMIDPRIKVILTKTIEMIEIIKETEEITRDKIGTIIEIIREIAKEKILEIIEKVFKDRKNIQKDRPSKSIQH